MQVLLVGGAGYIGGRLARFLGARGGVRLRILTPKDTPLHWKAAPGLDVFRADVREPESLKGSCNGITHVIYLAGLNQEACEGRPVEAVAVSGLGALHLAEEAARAAVQRFVYISSFHVYGSVEAELLTEELAVQPRNHYGLSRRVGEMYCSLVAERRGLSVVILRLSNGYGAPADEQADCWSLVVNDLCRQAIRDGRLVLKSSGRQQRDFLAMRDILAGMQLFLNVPADSLRQRVFNLGSGESVSILKVAERIRATFAERFGKELPLQTGGDPAEGRPFHFDIRRARALGFEPRGDMAEEIRELFSACG